MSPGRTDPSASRPVRSRPARPSRCATPSRPPVVCPGFGLDKCSCFQRHVQGVFFDRLGCKKDACLLGEPTRRRPVGGPCWPAPPRPAVPPCAAPSRPARGMSGFGFDKSKKSPLGVPLEARTNEFPFNPMEEQNPRLTTGLSAVYPRFIRWTTAALRSWLLTNVPTPICLCKVVSCKARPRIITYQTRTMIICSAL